MTNFIQGSQQKSIVNLYSTRNMEDSLQALAKVYPHIAFNRYYQNEFRIHLRMSKVKHVNWYFRGAGHKLVNSNESQVAAWRENTGILVDSYDTDFGTFGRCDAYLFAECPTSLYRIESAARHIDHCLVIYNPPTWSEHEKTVNRKSPPTDEVKKFFEVALTLNDYITDQEMRELSGVESLAAIRWFLQEHGNLKRQDPIFQIKLFYVPEKPALIPMANFILKYPVQENGYRRVPLFHVKQFNRRYMLFLKELAKEGALQKGPTLYYYKFLKHHVNWEMIARQHRMIRSEFLRIQELVENAPEFPAREILAGQIEYESPSAEVRFDDTVRLAQPVSR